MNKATVIIPTTGSDTLKQCIESVVNQTLDTKAYVVIDGNQFIDNVDIEYYQDYIREGKVQFSIIPENVGSNGFYGHRIYAGYTHFINSDYVLYLDQDCWFDENHVEALVDEIETNEVDWSHSLRKIVDSEGNYICNDDCESLGKWKPFVNYNHIDTNCYCIKTDIAVRISQVFHGKWGQDRIFYQALSQHLQKYSCSGIYSLNYRLGGNEGSVTSNFFIEGNKKVNECIGNFPWRKI